MDLLIPVGVFLLVAWIGMWLFVLRAPKKEDLNASILSIGESQIGREINAAIRELNEQRQSRNFLEKLSERLNQSQTGITVPYYLLIMVGAMFGIYMGSYLILNSMIFGILFALLGYFVPNMIVNSLRQRNISFFDRQLVSVLRRLSSLLRSGASLKQGLQDVSTSISVPVKVRMQFRQVLQQVEAGYALEPALFSMYERIGSESLMQLAVTVDVLRKQGADLPEVFETISQNISKRNMSERRVRATMAQLRASSNILSALPVVIGLALTMMQPSYFQPLFASDATRWFLFFIIAMMIVGFFVFRRMSKVE